MNVAKKMIFIIALLSLCTVMTTSIITSESSDADDVQTVVKDAITYKLLPGVDGGENTAEATSIARVGVPADLVIPKYITDGDGVKYRLTTINFKITAYTSNVKTLTIEANPGLTIINGFATYQYALTTVTLGEGVPIVNQMFQGSSMLANVTIPANTEEIGASAFANTAVSNIDLSKVKYIGSNAFQGTKLTSVSLDSVISIGASAFANCGQLTDMTFGDNLTSIGAGAFKSTKISVFTIPASVTDIGVGTTSFLDDLPAIVIDKDNPAFTVVDGILYSKDMSTIYYYPRTYTTIDGVFTTSANIGPYAFYNTLLKEIVIENGATEIGESAFQDAKYLRSVTMADSVVTLGNKAFMGCNALESVVLSDNITVIGTQTFSMNYDGSSKLKDIELPSKLESIGNNAFNYCASLGNITLPDTLTSIGSGSFSSCTNLVIDKLPANLKTIGGSAFSGCKSFNIAEIPASVTEIGGRAFENSGIVSLRIGIGDEPVNLPYNNYGLFQGSALKHLYLDNVTTDTKDVSFIVKQCTLESFTLGSKFTLWTWDEESGLGYDPETKTAYLLKPGVTKLIIPEHIENLYGTWFWNCGITEIDYEGSSDRVIGFNTGLGKQGMSGSDTGMFRNCANLVKVNLPVADLDMYDHGTFNRCLMLEEVYIEKLINVPNDMFPNATNAKLTKVIIKNASVVNANIQTYTYFELPENLTKFSGAYQSVFYDTDGVTVLNVTSDIDKFKGKTIIWNGVAAKNYKILADDERVITLDYNGALVYTYAKVGAEFDPSAITHNVYSADAWYTDAAKTQLYSPGTVTSNMTLYGDSDDPTVTITIRTEKEGSLLVQDLVLTLADGTVVNSGDSVPYGSVVYLNWTRVLGHGVTVGYNAGFGDSYIISTPGDTMSSSNRTVTSDTEFWVKLTLQKYTITYDTTGADPVPSVKADYGTPVVKPADPVREGYIFAGWSQDIPDMIPNSNMTIVAMWCPDKFPIILNAMGGSIEGGVTTITKTYNTMFTDLPIPTKVGYEFVGWFTEDGEMVQYEDVFQYTEGFDVYAHWAIDKFTIQFDTDGGSTISALVQYYGTPVVKPADPVRNGYVFVGWDTVVPTNMPGEDMVIKALWAAKVAPAPAGDLEVDVPAGGSFVMPDTESQTVKVDLDGITSVKVMDATGITSKTISVSVDAVINQSNIVGNAYEFVFKADGVGYNGAMQVTLPYAGIDGKAPVVYYWNGYTTVQMKVVSFNEDSVTFETDHNSTYIVASEDVATSAGGSTSSVTIAGVAIAAVIIGVLLGFFIARNRSA